MDVTLTLPEDLADQLSALDEAERREIVEAGLRKISGNGLDVEYDELRRVVEVLAGLPTPQEVLELRPSAEWQQRVSELLEKSRTDDLSTDEEQEWRNVEFTEHVVRLAKARAAARLRELEKAGT